MNRRMDQRSERQMDGWTMFLFYTDVIGATGDDDDNFPTDLAIFT